MGGWLSSYCAPCPLSPWLRPSKRKTLPCWSVACKGGDLPCRLIPYWSGSRGCCKRHIPERPPLLCEHPPLLCGHPPLLCGHPLLLCGHPLLLWWGWCFNGEKRLACRWGFCRWRG